MKIKPRYPETIVYESEAVWDGETGGTATVTDNRTIVFDTPKTYGGRGEGVCPDEMFVSAIVGCLINTFLDFKRKTMLELIALKLNGAATVKLDSEGYNIIGIKIEGEIVVDSDDLDYVDRAIEMMKKYCHLTRSISDCIPIEYDIVVKGEETED
ncbi:MAG: OsmC family protein [Candidatus Thorarchaeota archaeon]|nr:OsmC family protein [Candidatus Thorarchaeota archaeon]MCK5239503.1 OsmC family protein [Candidatus Thorarchaeota archaeon]